MKRSVQYFTIKHDVSYIFKIFLEPPINFIRFSYILSHSRNFVMNWCLIFVKCIFFIFIELILCIFVSSVNVINCIDWFLIVKPTLHLAIIYYIFARFYLLIFYWGIISISMKVIGIQILFNNAVFLLDVDRYNHISFNIYHSTFHAFVHKLCNNEQKEELCFTSVVLW